MQSANISAPSCKVWRQTHCDPHTWRWDWSRAAESCQRGFQVGWISASSLSVFKRCWLQTTSTCGLQSCHRFSCVPVDFEVVHVNSAVETEDDINNAITAIRRNGVALKGGCIRERHLPFTSESCAVNDQSDALRNFFNLWMTQLMTPQSI